MWTELKYQLLNLELNLITGIFNDWIVNWISFQKYANELNLNWIVGKTVMRKNRMPWIENDQGELELNLNLKLVNCYISG